MKVEKASLFDTIGHYLAEVSIPLTPSYFDMPPVILYKDRYYLRDNSVREEYHYVEIEPPFVAV